MVVVGTGIEPLGQMTPAATVQIRSADRLLYLTADPLSAQTLRSLNSSAESLRRFYAPGKDRLISYREMTHRMLQLVRRGLRVCAALYGHPGVFATPAHAAVVLARAEGHQAQMLPGISADACLIADLGIDPSTHGWQSYEATDFVIRSRRPDPTAGLLLWQVGVLGQLTFNPIGVRKSSIELLSRILGRIHPRDHEVILYEASCLPGIAPVIQRVSISALPAVKFSSVSTLYVPPSRRAKVSSARMKSLGITASIVRCLR